MADGILPVPPPVISRVFQVRVKNPFFVHTPLQPARFCILHPEWSREALQSERLQEMSRGIVNLQNARKIADFPFPFPYHQARSLALQAYLQRAAPCTNPAQISIVVLIIHWSLMPPRLFTYVSRASTAWETGVPESLLCSEATPLQHAASAVERRRRIVRGSLDSTSKTWLVSEPGN